MEKTNLTSLKITDRFLRAKHWQLFLLTFGIPILFQFVIMASIVPGAINETNPDPTMIFNSMKYYPFMMIISMAFFFGWFWSIATGLQEKLPDGVIMKIKKFKILFFFPLIYIAVFMTIFSIFVNGFFTTDATQNIGIIGNLFPLIFPLHIFSMICMIYSLYFVAKTFKTVELQREVKFGDFAGEFLLIWFYPLGIWIVQPKINKMVEGSNQT